MDETVISLEIELVDPPSAYAYCLQRGSGSRSERLDYVEVVEGNEESLTFTLEVTVRQDKSASNPDFFGPFVQGPRGARFFYLCVGASVDGGEPIWKGRVKVPLVGIDWLSVETAAEGQACLFASYLASRPDGSPVLASVRLLGEGWTVHRS